MDAGRTQIRYRTICALLWGLTLVLIAVTSATPLVIGRVASSALQVKSVNVRDFGAKGDGVTNDTSALKGALEAAAGGTLWIPKVGVGVYRTQPLKVPGNTRILFQAGAVLEALPGYRETDKILNIISVSQVVIEGGGVIRGLKAEYRDGEQKHGITIVNSTDVTIRDTTCVATGGDGIYVGGASANILLERVTCDSNRRNGLSITGCPGFRAVNCRFSNQSGTNPQCGVDIEPNGNAYPVDDILFERCTSSHNAQIGFVVNLQMLPGQNNRNVRIQFSHCSDEGSVNAFEVYRLDLGEHQVTGSVAFSDCSSKNAQNGAFSVRNWDARGPTIQIDRPVVVDCARAPAGRGRYDAPFAIFRESSDKGAPRVGNVIIRNASVTYTSGIPVGLPDYHFQDLTGIPCANISVIDPLRVGASSESVSYAMYFMASGVVTDAHNVLARAVRGTSQIRAFEFNPVINATGSTTIVLSSKFNPVGMPDLTLLLSAPGTLRVLPDKGSLITLGRKGLGKGLFSSNPGATMTLRRNSETSWEIIKISDNWDYD